MAAFRGGKEAGIFFHSIYEHADFEWANAEKFSKEDAANNLEELVDKFSGPNGIGRYLWTPETTEYFFETMRTPLGGPVGSLTLADIPKSQRLDELEFDLPLAGGLQWTNSNLQKPVAAKEIIQALRHRYDDKPDDDVMRKEYACREDFLGERKMAGFLNGLIDMVFKAPTLDGSEKWFVVDYKSNKIDPYGLRRYPREHYSHNYMRYAMEQHNYHLQYHLYSVALHRYLKYRIKDYSYKRDFGGCYYLFFRGMEGQATLGHEDAAAKGRVHGCFFDRPHEETIHEISELFQREELKREAS
jgi:ATP-dependent exoDNAse (exonuclease V) beta subunit